MILCGKRLEYNSVHAALESVCSEYNYQHNPISGINHTLCSRGSCLICKFHFCNSPQAYCAMIEYQNVFLIVAPQMKKLNELIAARKQRSQEVAPPAQSSVATLVDASNQSVLLAVNYEVSMCRT